MRKKLIKKAAVRAGFMMSIILAGGLFPAGSVRAASRSLNVETHTKEEIIQYIQSHTGAGNDALIYSQNPVTTAPYSAGALSDATQQQALAALNEMRYIAGIYHGVTADSGYISRAQTGALINYVNNKMSHSPEQPAGMSDEMYQLGCEGTGRGNIIVTSASTLSLSKSVIHSWMADADENNIDRIGHRRWCLNPVMGKTGFGAVSGSNGTHGVMYAFDASHSVSVKPTVVWPAQNMPTDYFKGNYPWSISSDTAFSTDVSVKLTRVSDNREWNFSDSQADGYFNYDKGGYGQSNCLVFRPSGITGYDNLDEFLVQVTENGEITLQYTVSFFDIEEIPEGTTITLSATSGAAEVAPDSAYKGKATITLSESGISADKLKLSSSDETVARAMAGESGGKIWLYIKGMKNGKAKITISLSRDIYAEYYVTVGTGEGHTHIYETEYRIDKAPGCGTEGSKSRHCTGCTEKTDITVIPETGEHDYEEVSVIREATCTTEGEAAVKCSVCGETATEVIEVTGHQYDSVYTVDKEADCKEEGTRSRHCKWFAECGQKTAVTTIPANPDNHKEELAEVLEASTCIKAGRGRYACKNCGESEEKEIPLLPHTYSAEWVVDIEADCTKAGKESRHCTGEGCTAITEEREIPALDHTGGTATCEKKAVCEVCGQEYGGLAEHRESGWIIDKEPAYTTEGSRHKECVVCRRILKSETIAALPVQTGEEVAVQGMSYKVTANNGGKRTVTCNGTEQKTSAGSSATVRIPAVVTIGGQAYKVTAVAPKAFAKNSRLKTVIMGKYVTQIEDSAFSGCKNLSQVTLASGVAGIGKKAFYQCGKLKKITIPASVKTIGAKAFYGCKKLKTINIKTKKLTGKRVGNLAFKGIAKKAGITVPKSKAKAYAKLLKSKGVSAKAVFKSK
ncbi:MAG: leucine-rich repeat protein [Bacteroidales bacterium]|nr:leucine-rich repeat protein [Clostridium sp.]MCM1204773.1 leucine-rich repeat protein [Bacteroidales bacterium]